MKALSNRTGLVVIGFATAALALGAAGCSSNSDNNGGGTGGGSSANTCTTTNALQIAFNPMYSAYVDDPSLTFQIPAIVNGVSGAGVVWSADDMSKVKLEPGDASGGVLITMLKAGTVNIQANLNGSCGSAPLTITEASKAEWQAGNDRYNNNNPLPMVMTDPATGLPMVPMAGFVVDPPDHPPACTNCHGATATSSFFKTVSHTPQQTGGFSDDQLGGIITQAAVPTMPPGYFDNSIIPMQFWMFFHRWSDITGDNIKGMVIYLRSLPPKAQSGVTDFGGFTMMRPPTGAAGATGAGGAVAGTGGATTGTGGATGSGGASGASTGGAAGTKSDAGP